MEELNSIISEEALESKLEEILRSQPLATMTRRQVRECLEDALDLERNSLVQYKKPLATAIDAASAKVCDEGAELQESQASTSSIGVCQRGSVTRRSPTKTDTEASPSKRGSEPPKNLSKRQKNKMKKSDFLAQAKSLPVKLTDELSVTLTPRLFAPGSCGWYYGSKAEMPVGEDKVWCQISINCSVLGSKEWS